MIREENGDAQTPEDRLIEQATQSDGTRPESWQPAIGEMIAGYVVRYDRASTPYNPEALICVLRDKDTGVERSVWLLHEVLWGEFKKKEPRVGEFVVIKRHGNGVPKDKGKQPYQRFGVFVDRPAAETEPWGESGQPDMFGPEDELQAARTEARKQDVETGAPPGQDYDDVDDAGAG